MRICPPPPTTSIRPVAPVHVFEAYLPTADPDLASPFAVRRSKKGPPVRVPESCPITEYRGAAYAPPNFLLRKRGACTTSNLAAHPVDLLESCDIAIGPITSDHAFVTGSWARLAALLSQSGRAFGHRNWERSIVDVDIGQ
ncbi:hypothetical protein NA56DRAFT_708904 [Hyaloscypha hepaticicola]|uniref:Uncharacterized protein n=1 Tax=Hyaloscypha hepaticicola TaxID=2082293 RepID=A0A2J6PQP0_9HELO|nr:hypothetical protein NA56DRAFT_708904 [Hyaloscypha hepaticicola]